MDRHPKGGQVWRCKGCHLNSTRSVIIRGIELWWGGLWPGLQQSYIKTKYPAPSILLWLPSYPARGHQRMLWLSESKKTLNYQQKWPHFSWSSRNHFSRTQSFLLSHKQWEVQNASKQLVGVTQDPRFLHSQVWPSYQHEAMPVQGNTQ